MTRAIALGGMFAAGMVVGGAGTTLTHAQVPPQVPPYQTTEVLHTDLADLPGEEVIVFASTWQPGAALPRHMHPNGHEITYVVEGEQTFEIEGVGTKVVKAGEAIYTPPNTPHFGRNATNGISRTLVIRIKEKNKPVTVVLGR